MIGANTRVVILGAGVGGTLTANRLARSDGRLDVTVLDGDERHLYQPGLIAVALGRRTLGNFERPRRRLLDPRVRLIPAGVRAVDPDARRIETEAGDRLDYDFLVVATGCRPRARTIPGFREGAFHFHCAKRAVHLKDALDAFDAGHIVVGATRLPYKCPPSPHEFALLLDDILRRDGRRRRARITFVYPLPRAYPVPALAGMLEEILRERDISVAAPFTVKAVDPGRRRVESAEGRSLNYDLLVLVPPHEGEPILAAAGLAKEGGWVAADRGTLRVRDRVYALGDAADLAVPKSGAAAHYQAAVAAANVLAEAAGREPPARYDGHVTCLFETGRRRGGKVDFAYDRPPVPRLPGRLPWLQKRLFERMYFSALRRA